MSRKNYSLISVVFFVLLFSIFLCSFLASPKFIGFSISPLETPDSTLEVDKIDAKVTKALEKEDKVEVVIRFKENQKRREKEATIDSLKKVTYEAKTVNAVTALVTKQELQALENNPKVEHIEKEKQIKIMMQDTVWITNATLTWPLQIGGINATGIDETVCVIDTGVNYSHSDLGGCFGAGCKIIGGWDFVNDDADPYDDHGHGTHVIGTVAAAGNLLGMAPGAKIVALKACNSGGTCGTLAITDSLNWCINNATTYNISVISMSFGSNAPDIYDYYCDNQSATDRLWANIINNATAKNISIVAATGNNGNTTAIGSPACIKNVTAVASTTKADAVSSFSNRNNLTDLFAPGTSINSTSWTGSYELKSGTSMSTPHVSGAMALLRGYVALQGTTLTNQEVQDALQTTGIQINDTGSGLIFSRISIYDAVLVYEQNDPTITLATPANGTGLPAGALINFTITDDNSISTATWTTNGAQNNFDITQNNTYSINTTTWQKGWHNITVFANDTASNNANLTRQLAITDTWLIYDYDAIDLFNPSINLSLPFNLALVRYAFGIINFTQQVNFSQKVANQQLLDFTIETNLSYNRIFIDAVDLPELNKSATITLYNLTFTEPKMMRNGAECPSSICTNISYSGGTFIFNVTSFSIYTAAEGYVEPEEEEEEEEDNSTDGSDSGAGAAGGGGEDTTTSCTESWTCDSWSTCINGEQSRTCTDANSCGTTASQPLTTRRCGEPTITGETIKAEEETPEDTTTRFGILGAAVRLGGNVVKLGKSYWIAAIIVIILVVAIALYLKAKAHSTVKEKVYLMTSGN